MGIKENSIRQFGNQAELYSKSFIFQDKSHLSEIIKRSEVKKNHNVLDIATGGGFLALEFAIKANKVIGLDITRKILIYAKEKQTKLGLENIEFLVSDVESLPFHDEFFDIISCRFAFHHFPDPIRALSEMKRVCKNQGRIVLVDGTSSENNSKSIFHNNIEKIRDTSHVNLYKLSEMIKMLQNIGCFIVNIKHWDIVQDFDDWIKRSGCDKKKINIIKDLMMKSETKDCTGLRVKIKNHKLKFTYDTVILIIEMKK